MIDLRPAFHHYRWEPMAHSNGVLVGCDWVDWLPDSTVPEVYRRNGSLTVDEVAVLHECASRLPGRWLDVGGSTGWSAAHMATAGCGVDSIDPMYAGAEFRARAEENLGAAGILQLVGLWSTTSDQFFDSRRDTQYAGALIDGNHDRPCPENDAKNAAERLETPGVILLHDGYGAPVQDAVRALVAAGFRHRAYPSPQGLVVCWRGDFEPPAYSQDNEAILAKAARYYAELSS